MRHLRMPLLLSEKKKKQTKVEATEVASSF
nr:MAG TPA: hypothetical protein [Caudoviricetes sp.]